jgi:hypothetical protein
MGLAILRHKQEAGHLSLSLLPIAYWRFEVGGWRLENLKTSSLTPLLEV